MVFLIPWCCKTLLPGTKAITSTSNLHNAGECVKNDQPYTCQYCENLIIDSVALKKRKEIAVTVSIPQSWAGVEEQARRGCLFLQWYEKGKRDYDVWEERELRPGLALTVAFGHRNDPADIASISGGFGEAWVVHAHPGENLLRVTYHNRGYRDLRGWRQG